ncbi:MAG: DNA-binding response regulator [Oscillospiraceae bacterium]|jgi:response regulators consisting of a cheY-like receiver domain and a winged-helix DNA-binding domain|nr:MAG: DNA-binding response regulator [Oscillospiraceae bacterium]
MYRIFLAEDDHALAEAISRQLESWGNEVITVRDFRRVSAEFAEARPQLVLLDIMLPFYDGYHWCTEIRKLSSVPIVFISSASDNMNIVMAMNMGGDDFIPKPVDPMVLTAKLQALLRRTYELGEPCQALECHGALLDLSSGTLECGGQRLELTKNEFRILRTLLENRDKTVSRERLMTVLWQSDCYVEENTLTVNVARLRKKLEGVGLGGIIATKPGEGYILR